MLCIGIDVGGTFTDLVAVDALGRVTLAKAASTPADQSLGVMEGLDRLAEALGTDRAAMLADTERIVHGTTVATNALLEHKGAKVGLLTTEGHRDIIEMREGLKDDRYNLRQPPPTQLVPRERRLGVRERIRPDGRVEIALDRGSLEAAIAVLKSQAVEAVAICYLHSWCDGGHERITAEAVRAAMPGVYVSLSAEVLPQIKEYDRLCTTVVNAYVGPALERYLTRLETRLREAGLRAPVLIIQSHGGVATIAESVRLAAGGVLSGPAGGVAGSQYAARLLDHGNLIPFDMGGTSTDISLVVSGEAAIASDRRIAGQRVALQSLDIASIGAGGGSIARVDHSGVLHVGPESAGAQPGPACYGRGGVEATVTDANLVLGFLDPDNFLGGRARLDPRAAEAAVDRIAGKLGVDRMTAAEGIHRVINTHMAEGIRLVSVRRGVDPRRFAILSFGGAAALHVTDVARQLDLGRVIVPRLSAVLSAWGMLASDLRCEVARTHIGDASRLDATKVRAAFREMEAEGRRRLGAASFEGPIRVRPSADMRYGEQVFEVSVPLDSIDFGKPDLLRKMADAFHHRHEELYTYSLRDQEAVLVNARVAVIGELPALPQEPGLRTRPAAKPRGQRRIYLGQWREVPTYDFDALAPGQTINGPAVIESPTTTVLLRPGDRVRTTAFGWLDVEVQTAEKSWRTPMKFGLRYCNTARYVDPKEAIALAQAAEAAGFESLWTVEHTIVPAGYASAYPYDPSGKMAGGRNDIPLPDPLIWMAFVAAATTRINLATGIMILPQHNPVLAAKQIATLDHLSRGRILLGIGVGWLQEEFAALGVPFAERGARTDEYIAAMRELWSADKPTFKGRFVAFEGAYCRPQPVNKSVPIIVGGHSEAAARRAGRLGDGFFPARGAPAELIAIARKAAETAGRDPDKLEITASLPDDLAELDALRRLGVTRVLVPSAGGAGLPARIRGPDDLASWTEVIERHRAA